MEYYAVAAPFLGWARLCRTTGHVRYSVNVHREKCALNRSNEVNFKINYPDIFIEGNLLWRTVKSYIPVFFSPLRPSEIRYTNYVPPPLRVP